jgi:hypothetical protein
MVQKATSQNLLYIGDNGSGGVLVYSYAPGYKLVGFLAAPRYPGGECVDKVQDVFIPDAGGGGDVTFEYAHGGTEPIAILGDLGGGPVACSIDPTTGNLAVTSRDPHSDSSKLAVYKAAKGKPTFFSDSSLEVMEFCGYDSAGNLFVDGSTTWDSGQFQLAELAKGSKTFTNITLDQAIKYGAGVQWDGKHVAVGDSSKSIIYQFAISGSTGTKVGSTTLKGSYGVSQFFIDDNKIINPSSSYYYQGSLEIYDYPAGGRAVGGILGVGSPYSAVVSLGTDHDQHVH